VSALIDGKGKFAAEDKEASAAPVAKLLIVAAPCRGEPDAGPAEVRLSPVTGPGAPTPPGKVTVSELIGRRLRRRVVGPGIHIIRRFMFAKHI
jgi:hypothetical protein